MQVIFLAFSLFRFFSLSRFFADSLTADSLISIFRGEDEMSRLPYVWDYEMTEAEFEAILRGEAQFGRLDRDWAAVRLLEYAPYRDIIRLLGYRALLAGWPRWRAQVRSVSRKRGLDFLAAWLPEHHPELL